MPNKRLSMRKIKEVLRLKFDTRRFTIYEKRIINAVDYITQFPMICLLYGINY